MRVPVQAVCVAGRVRSRRAPPPAGGGCTCEGEGSSGRGVCVGEGPRTHRSSVVPYVAAGGARRTDHDNSNASRRMPSGRRLGGGVGKVHREMADLGVAPVTTHWLPIVDAKEKNHIPFALASTFRNFAPRSCPVSLWGCAAWHQRFEVISVAVALVLRLTRIIMHACFQPWKSGSSGMSFAGGPIHAKQRLER